jgi:hypothetical protein
MTRVVISQPMYFPWVGFMAQMALADVMIWLDDAQFSKGSFTNRVQVKTANGIKWLSIPLKGQGSGQLIHNLETSDPLIADRQSSLLKNAFDGCPHKANALTAFGAAWGDHPLVETLISSCEGLAKNLGLPHRETLRSSEMNVLGKGNERVLALVKAAKGSTYITGHGARNYLDHTQFQDAGVHVEYMDYEPLPWSQGPDAFTPYVTALDLVARVPQEDRFAHLAPKTQSWQTFMT